VTSDCRRLCGDDHGGDDHGGDDHGGGDDDGDHVPPQMPAGFQL
jgi:hypothetical protein